MRRMSDKDMDCNDDSSSDDSMSRVNRKMSEKMRITSDYMKSMCHPRIHHNKLMSDFDFGHEEFMLFGPSGDGLGMHGYRGLRREMKPPPKREVTTITLNCLVPEYKNFVLENIKTFTSLCNKMVEAIEVPSKNFKIFQDAEQTKMLNFDRDFDQLIEGGKSIVLYFSVHPDFEDIIKHEELGHGPFGTVYKCSKFGSKDMFVLKKFKNQKDKAEESRQLHKELDIYIKLGNHPRIVKLNRYFISAKASYIELEYMSGGSLRSYLHKNGAQNEPVIIQFAKQILEALDFLHGQNILHRDLKGPKILLDENLNVKLCGFMSAKVLTDISSENFRNSAADSNVGTANWTAPEVINGERYGSSADIWSFGAIMVELITGKAPLFFLASFQAIYRLGTQKKIEFTYPLNSTEKLKSFVNQCLDPDPLKRPTVKELMAHEFLN